MRNIFDEKAWAEMEFAQVDIGDLRRSRRLVKVGQAMAKSSKGTKSLSWVLLTSLPVS